MTATTNKGPVFDIRIEGNGTKKELIVSLEKFTELLKGRTEGELTKEDLYHDDGTSKYEVWNVIDVTPPGYEPSDEDIEQDAFDRETGTLSGES